MPFPPVHARYPAPSAVAGGQPGAARGGCLRRCAARVATADPTTATRQRWRGRKKPGARRTVFPAGRSGWFRLSLNTSVGADPGGRLAVPAERRTGQGDDGSDGVEEPVGERVPDHPVVVTTDLCFVAPIDDEADHELHEAGDAEHHAMPLRLQGFDMERRWYIHEFAQR